MVNESGSDERRAAGEEAARILIEIGAVKFRPSEPYILTAGWASPVYIDCRKLISYLDQRRRVIALGAELIQREIGADGIDLVAGGETAGIPYAAWISETLEKPMLYVRKQPKGFGQNAQIEGDLEDGKRVLLVEDLATDGGSKINFIDALRLGGGVVTDVFVVFYYHAFPGAEETMKKAGTNLHYLADWHDVLAAAEAGRYFSDDEIAGVREFLANPISWSAANGGLAGAD
ncbi:MAG: orotate phosphoribosyltransferase [Rhodospirillales bacterium]|jgi:orotate phosphoribosyltransferase|nr:orotate phosphoribosyltransferase [Rhodospirillaceae bacterium]MDP6427698.1 orotate phosphoribosyltransferase [Rhodospirillales bacterium]MDP6645462.1 orotate phosphoribosyltransferase [Rhodospirillales bacterium]MDP6841712.1 orotate phosphoribosyltransferase [Rhodospirillales bacterium]|tara:strand:- start:113 stop:808 length:696 start_codon:yes stop_codon:yes gene_type:complete